MQTACPVVSVIIPSYNHERFISAAIDSVLRQTFDNFEIIIVDDCSTDRSVEVIKKYTDDRVRLFLNEKNQGAVYTTNFAIQQAKGNYIALLNSDDMWEPNKLELQVRYLEDHMDISAVFSNAKFVNEDNKVLSKTEFFWADVFEKENRSSAKWLRYFFFYFNCLCHPSILIRKEAYELTNLYDPALRQLPDFKMWVHLLKYAKIHVLSEKLVVFRSLSSNENASADTAINRNRTRNELYLILKDFFENMSSADFIEGFGDLLHNKNTALSDDQIKCEQAFIYLKVDSEVAFIYKFIALEKFHELLNEDITRTILDKEYNFNYKDYFNMTGSYEFLDSSQKTISNIVIDTARKHLEKKKTLSNILKNIFMKIRNKKRK